MSVNRSIEVSLERFSCEDTFSPFETRLTEASSILAVTGTRSNFWRDTSGESQRHLFDTTKQSSTFQRLFLTRLAKIFRRVLRFKRLWFLPFFFQNSLYENTASWQSGSLWFSQKREKKVKSLMECFWKSLYVIKSDRVPLRRQTSLLDTLKLPNFSLINERDRNLRVAGRAFTFGRRSTMLLVPEPWAGNTAAPEAWFRRERRAAPVRAANYYTISPG